MYACSADAGTIASPDSRFNRAASGCRKGEHVLLNVPPGSGDIVWSGTSLGCAEPGVLEVIEDRLSNGERVHFLHHFLRLRRRFLPIDETPQKCYSAVAALAVDGPDALLESTHESRSRDSAAPARIARRR